LPFLGEESLYDSFDRSVPVGDGSNARGRATELPLMLCPTDSANTVENHFQRSGLAAADDGYARGNYAINGGTNRRCLMRLSRRKVNCKEGVLVDGSDLQRDTSKVWGNGVAGVNRGMRRAEFTGGLSQIICVEEIRAGLHPLDRRGVWALGFPGSSITACHGLYGNNGPNRGKDAIQGCSDVAAHIADLEQQGMPCLKSQTDPRLEISERATARSMHVGGVNLLMADGSAHFIADSIETQAWHSLHKRDHDGPIEF
jgi:prepilin-type processing-associated H-X9-DG protein